MLKKVQTTMVSGIDMMQDSLAPQEEKFDSKGVYEDIVNWIKESAEKLGKTKIFIPMTSDYNLSSAILCVKLCVDALGDSNVKGIALDDNTSQTFDEYCDSYSIGCIHPNMQQLKMSFRNNLAKCTKVSDVDVLKYAVARAIAGNDLLCVPHTAYEEYKGRMTFVSYNSGDIAPLLNLTPKAIMHLEDYCKIEREPLAPSEQLYTGATMCKASMNIVLSPMRYIGK